MTKRPFQEIKDEARDIFERGEMTLEVFDILLNRASEHCRAYPSALASLFEYAPREWVERIQIPKRNT